eukprot:Plantae.Rhodophyta-Rhodochaete_pulchella.ctg26733.p1 GENE.Plantae.Rhodophyta-Rhodochaete_pulchella.ctg26733~~Plantae.Rhodophyta-Rhodochaete_pulchella.ctg26733.p1  ORF type:complete len:362 (+),score=47.17 Plantae.Rhodophyta-Rhodochaete_pulchella.ctg26733:183-1268(+)
MRREHSRCSAPILLLAWSVGVCIKAESTFQFTVINATSSRIDPVVGDVAKLLRQTWVSTVPVNVLVSFERIREVENGLAVGYATDFIVLDGFRYTIASAEAIQGVNLNGNSTGEKSYDIVVKMNPLVNWYISSTGIPNLQQHDFFTVLLHEVLHGLLFTGHAQAEWNSEDNVFVAGFGENPYMPSIFDRYVTTSKKCAAIGFVRGNDTASATEELYQAITSETLFFGTEDEPNMFNLHAPKTFESASSVYHVATTQIAGVNWNQHIMSPSLGKGFYRREIDKEVTLVQEIVLQGHRKGAPRLCAPGTYVAPASKIYGLARSTFYIIIGAVVGIVVAVLISFCFCCGLQRKPGRRQPGRQLN